tara:strand:+ start:8052 stop:9908 length:1857 start_codon:yes stop_codon:yes gene_type:complete
MKENFNKHFELSGIDERKSRLICLVVLSTFLLSGCAVATAARNGQRAEQVRDYDRAVIEYTKALSDNPDNREARQALDRVKLRAAQEHYTRGRRLEAAGNLDEALVEFQLASELNPGWGDVEDALRSIRIQLRNRIAVSREGKTRLEALIDRSRNLPLDEFDFPSEMILPETIAFRDASARDVFTAIARLSKVSIIFDPDFRNQNISIDLRNLTLKNALHSISAATKNFYRITGPETLTIIPDTPTKRNEYEEEVIRTFYLSNADLAETIDLLRIVVDARRIAPLEATNALTIKDSPERVIAAAKIIDAIDKARPEIIIDVELLEVDRTRFQEYGINLGSTTSSEGIDGRGSINQEGLTLRSLRNLTQSDIFLTNLPGLFYRLLKTDSNTRTLANPQLRTSEGIAAQARFGERVPVPVTTFSPIATGGVAQQPITSFNYENIGVNIDITPRTHHDDEVSLDLKIEVSSISGSGFGGLPTFGNRAINTTIRLRDGETNMLAGLIRDDERTTVKGVPGLSDIPLIGKLFAHSRRETQETDILLTLTPRIIRVLEVTEDDLRPFRLGRATSSAGVEIPFQINDRPDLTATDESLPDTSQLQQFKSEKPAQPIMPTEPSQAQ